MKKNLILIIILSFGFSGLVSAQEKTKTRKKRLEDAIYGNTLFPSVSSIIIPKGFVEVNMFNSLLTAKNIFDNDKKKDSISGINTFYFSTFQITYGISKSGRLNLGLDIGYTAYRQDAVRDNSPFKIFGSDFTTVYGQKKDFTTIGVRARFLPLADNKKLVIQSGFTFPVANERIQNFTGQNRIAWNNQVLYNFQLGDKFFLFTQLSIQYNFKKNDTYKANLYTPISLFGSYRLGDKILPFILLTHTPIFGNNGEKKFSLYSFNTQYGIGLQFQPSLRFSLNGYYADTFYGKNANAWKSFNLGIRVVI